MDSCVWKGGDRVAPILVDGRQNRGIESKMLFCPAFNATYMSPRLGGRSTINSSGSRPNDRFPYLPRTNAFPPCGINVMNRPKKSGRALILNDGRAAQQLSRLQGVLRSLRRQAPMSNGASAPWGVLGRLIGGQQQSCR